MATANGSASSSASDVVELNVGGVYYTTSLATLTSGQRDSVLAKLFNTPTATVGSGCHGDRGGEARLHVDNRGRYFIDRDGVLFRFVLDFLRNGKVILPENFHERERLKVEAEFYGLTDMSRLIDLGSGAACCSRNSDKVSDDITMGNTQQEQLNNNNAEKNLEDKHAGYITLGYRGTFASGREGMSDVRFRKLTRILVCGRVSLCRQVFGDALNESRDPDRGLSSRYTSRFFLKHTSLEQAFESLQEAGFVLIGCCASGTSGAPADTKPGSAANDSEENRWNHYNEFVFCRTWHANLGPLHSRFFILTTQPLLPLILTKYSLCLTLAEAAYKLQR